MRPSAVGLGLAAAAQAAYVWPSKYDDIDDLLYLQSGFLRHGSLADQIKSCDFGAGQPGIQKTAEWIRTAFHDAVTHDKAAGTGGLDASIQYELDRQENKGAALNSTLADLSSDVSTRNSAADLLALSLVMSVERCGGLKVPLRLGRVDATDPGIAGVPEAFTDLETTTKRFATAGFSQEDMITLVACGHTVGSVHSVDHPEIVSGEPTAENIAQFDKTAAVFDNAPVTEFLSNTTTNPLIVNKNDTLNSDKRVFGADGQATMRKLSDAAVFKAQCTDVFERLLHLVPAGVALTAEPLAPVDVKPQVDTLQLNASSSTLTFEGRLRVRITAGTGRDVADMSVSLAYRDRTGAAVAGEIAATPARYQGGTTAGYGELFQWFEWSAALPVASGISGFDIKIASAANGTVTVYDNAGTGGYPVSADVLFQERNSCLTTAQVGGVYTGNMTLVAAVHKDRVGEAADGVLLKYTHRRQQPRNFIPKIEVVDYELAQLSTSGDYVYYGTTLPVASADWTTQFDIVAGNSSWDYQTTAVLGGGKACEAIA